MDTVYISAAAALAGSIIGGLTALATSWLGQRAQARSEELDSRQEATRGALF